MSKEVNKAVGEVNLQFSEGLRRGDSAAMIEVYTEDAVILPPNSDLIRGRKGIQEFWEASMKAGVKDAVLTTVELSVSDDTAQEIGRAVLTVQPEGQEPIENEVKYVVVWKLTADGWKWHWDIWNSTVPPQ